MLRVAKGDLSVGELVVFVSYTRKASSPMRSFAREAAKLTAALARADRIAEVLTEDDVIEDRPHAYRGGRARGELELEHVTFQYAGERAALQRRSHQDRRRPAARADRPVRRGQVHARRARRPLLRPDARAAC